MDIYSRVYMKASWIGSSALIVAERSQSIPTFYFSVRFLTLIDSFLQMKADQAKKKEVKVDCLF